MKNLPNKGFSLIETLVAISILMLAMIGPLSAASVALKSSETAQDELVATSLAQEGLEFVLAVRDDNYLATMKGDTHNWLQDLDPCREGYECTVDALFQGAAGVQSCNYTTCPPLYISDTHVYNQQHIGSPSRFTRSVLVNDDPNDSATEEVVVTVSWTTRHGTRSLTAKKIIKDWYHAP